MLKIRFKANHKTNIEGKMKKTILIVLIVAAAAGIVWYVRAAYLRRQELENPRFYSGNGRLEATEVYVSA